MDRIYTTIDELKYESMIGHSKYLENCGRVITDVLDGIYKAIRAGSPHEKEMLVLAFDSFSKKLKSFLEEYADVVTIEDFIRYARGYFLFKIRGGVNEAKRD